MRIPSRPPAGYFVRSLAIPAPGDPCLLIFCDFCLDGFLDTDESHYGLSGSPTQVERIFPPENDTEHEMWEGPGLADRLYEHLKARKFV